MLFSVVHDPAITASDLNHDLQIINVWAHQWKMAFNPEVNKEAVEIVFSQKRNKLHHPTLFFNGSVVCKVESYKYLGLTLELQLTFINHINSNRT